MDKTRSYKKHIRALEEENKKLREQIHKIQNMVDYFKETTLSYVDASPDEKELKFTMFAKYLEQIHCPRNIMDDLLRSFYQYVIQHLELQNIQKKLKK